MPPVRVQDLPQRVPRKTVTEDPPQEAPSRAARLVATVAAAIAVGFIASAGAVIGLTGAIDIQPILATPLASQVIGWIMKAAALELSRRSWILPIDDLQGRSLRSMSAHQLETAAVRPENMIGVSARVLAAPSLPAEHGEGRELAPPLPSTRLSTASDGPCGDEAGSTTWPWAFHSEARRSCAVRVWNVCRACRVRAASEVQLACSGYQGGS